MKKIPADKIRFRSVRLRLYPSKDQETLFQKNVGRVRWLYNYALGKRIEFYEKTGGNPSYIDMQNQLPLLKEHFPWLKEVESHSLQVALRNLDTAYKNFFRRVTHGGVPGFPKFKKKGSRDSFTVNMNMGLEGSYLRVSKHGWIKARGGLTLLEDKKIKSITVSRQADHWYASCLIEAAESEVHVHRHEICGIDLGVKRPVTVAYTSVYAEEDKSYWFGRKEFQANLTKKETRRKRYQKQLARKVKGSKNREKTKLKVQRAFMHEANYRKNFVEQVSKVLAHHFRVIVFEDLKISNMTKSSRGTLENPGTNVKAKSGLNREMLRLGLSSLITRTEQKSRERGGEILFINPKYTSQTCNCCGHVDKLNRKSQAKFKCRSCGHEDNADRNAALNIRDLGIAQLEAA